MVLIVSPHNVIKKEYTVSNFETGKTNKLEEKHVSIYSQGINIALTSKILQTEPFLLTFFGGVNGKHVKNHLHVNKIKCDNVHMSKNSYEKINIIDKEKNVVTVIKDYFNQVEKKFELAFINLVKEHLKRCQLAIFEERTAKYLSEDALYIMCEEARQQNVRTIIDVKQAIDLNLIESIKPFAVKLNVKALQESNINIDDENEITHLAKELINKGIHYVLIDKHKEKASIYSKKHILRAVDKKNNSVYEHNSESTDAFLAGFASCISKGYEEEKTLRLAYASEIAVLKYGTIENLNRKYIFDLKKDIKISMEKYED